MNLFKKIAQGFGKTREAVVTGLKTVVAAGAPLDEDQLENMEEILITADLGVNTTLELLERLRKRSRVEVLQGDTTLRAMAEELDQMMRESTLGEEPEITEKPWVSFIVGVNGSGKTTTIGKLAQRYAKAGEKVVIVAADTFRSAAVEQLTVWAERANVEIIRGATGADPGAVVYDGLSAALSREADRVLVDTAGRLHTKINLMKELEKLNRVAKKVIPSAPHDTLLVVDGTTGQNGLVQARAFSEACGGVDGLVVTKLDGTAKGGVILPIGRELGIQVRWIGVGEGIDDIVPFHPEMVVKAVFGEFADNVEIDEAATVNGTLEDGNPG